MAVNDELAKVSSYRAIVTAVLEKVEEGLLTAEGRRIGRERTALMRSFVEDMRREILFN